MICKRCGSEQVLKATIYDKAEQKLYCDFFSNMVELKTHLAIRNIAFDAVLILKEITKPLIVKGTLYSLRGHKGDNGDINGTQK